MLRLFSRHSLCALQTTPTSGVRCFGVSANALTMSRSYEPAVQRSSDEHTDPLGWAKQIFDLQKKGIFEEWNKVKEGAVEPLLLVCRTRHYERLPHYEKEVLSHFGLGRRRKNFEWTIVKNVASTNALLAKVAYLIKVIPLRFPNGIPDDPQEFAKMTLKVTGEFVRRNSLAHHSQLSFADVKVPASSADPGKHANSRASSSNVKFGERDPRRLAFSHEQLMAHHNLRYKLGKLNSEYFATQYRYEHNQDSAEYRNSGLWRHSEAERHAENSRRNADGTLKPGNRFEPNYSVFPFRR